MKNKQNEYKNRITDTNHITMTPFLSQKIKLLSLISIILVLYIHSGFHDYPNEIQGMPFNFKLQDFISGKIGRCAVPLFYAISGYLFFLNLNNKNILWAKIKKRIMTLVVPYIIAALFFPCFYIIVSLIPSTARFFNSESISTIFNLPVWNIFQSIFYDPLAFHLWFLRDLIIIVALSPFLYYIKNSSKKGEKILLIAIFLLNLCNIKYIPVSAMFWFLAGDIFLIKLENIKNIRYYIAFLLISTIELIYPSPRWSYFQIPIIALGVISIWNIYNRLVTNSFILKKHKWLYIACQFTFFIYLFHEPTLNIIRKLLIIILGHSSIGFAVNYLISPWIFTLLFIIIGFYFKKNLPKLYSICVGGR